MTLRNKLMTLRNKLMTLRNKLMTLRKELRNWNFTNPTNGMRLWKSLSGKQKKRKNSSPINSVNSKRRSMNLIKCLSL